MKAPTPALDQFYQLTPEVVMQGIEQWGLKPTGQYTQLNSYENRVFDIVLEPQSREDLGDRVIAKFYRPQRWSQEAILEEHDFLQELQQAGIPAVAPLKTRGKSLSLVAGLWLTLFPKTLGRIPQELSNQDLHRIGRRLAQIHNVGEQRPALHRPHLTPEDLGWPALDRLSQWVAPEVWSRYEKAAEEILAFLEEALEPEKFIRIHGDCHKGNLLQQDRRWDLTEAEKFGEALGSDQMGRQFFFVDFDDFCMGPVVQDFWMLFAASGSQGEQDKEDLRREQESLLAGYTELRDFRTSDLELIPGLRGLRIIHYAGWIARRWQDPSFPRLFPQFRDYSYWAEETEALERIAWGL